ncbi:hypothetical protein ADK86_21110 [Streptomyces sp. NRRL F-5755]|uniref:hypothetical protein n=1 Tax=Streptomyces sp. NRRL F-5755 TaxID=1519475 RepID=UPI0006AE06F0|nr:hypothetical protein [Streptomyces sp. NRRL F-5755]KOT92160.1 hypothetical protein ADK86_21110 [Streptomyces sp. NRRL F-5755]
MTSVKKPEGRASVWRVLATSVALVSVAGVTLVGVSGSAQAMRNSDGKVEIHQVDLDTGRKTPGVVYRGEPIVQGSTRDPNEVFRDGFTSRGTNYDLPRHLHGGTQHQESGYISTSSDPETAQTFALQPTGNIRTNDDGSKTEVYEGWVYDIRGQGNMIYLPDQITPGSALDHFRSQDEWAAIRHINAEDIVQATRYRQEITTDATGQRRRGAIEQRGHLVNPNANANGNGYDPDGDAKAKWNAQVKVGLTAPNSPRNLCASASGGSKNTTHDAAELKKRSIKCEDLFPK